MEKEVLIKSIPRGRWYRIIPVLIMVYVVSYMDKMNIGFAIAGGMDKELGMTAGWAGFAAGIYFIGYLFLQIPGGHIAEKGSAKKFIMWSLIAWSLMTIVAGFAQNTTQMLIVRFLIGLAEGGVFPAIYAIIGRWFPAEETGKASAVFISCTAIASIISGPLSGYILTHWDWRTLFIVEGLMSLSLIFVWYPLISDRPRDAKWISKEELEYLETKLEAEKAKIEQTNNKTTYKDLLKEPNIWKLSIIYFLFQSANNAYVMWLPSFVKKITGSGMTMLVGYLTSVPFIITLVGLVAFGYLSDKALNRKKYTIYCLLGFGACFLLSVVFKNQVWVGFAFLALCGFFMKPTISLISIMPKILYPSTVAGGARGIVNALGNLGGLFGPTLVGWASTGTNYDMGIMAMVVCLVISAGLTATLPRILSGVKENGYEVAKKSPAK